MASFRPLSAVEQLTEHLRMELSDGTWSSTMPGGDRLAKALGVRRSTVEGALQQLEQDGWLMNQGRRRRRLIKLPESSKHTSLRVAMLLFEPSDTGLEVIGQTRYLLEQAGHVLVDVSKTLCEMRMDVARVAQLVEQTKADAWVIAAGSKEVLEWFAQRREPAFAMFGRRQRVDIASVGPDTTPTIREVVRRLVELGHQRVVMFSRRERRLPEPAQFERAFLEELEACGCLTGAYNLPDWEGTKDGFQAALKSLFHLTPPTALIIHEAPHFIAALQFLARKGIRIPHDVSLICTDPDQSFSWCEPEMAHISWDVGKAARRVVRWARNVNRGKPDKRQTNIRAEFIEGGTVGPVKR